MFEIYKIALIVICVTGTGLLPLGIHIHTYARYNYGGIWIIALAQSVARYLLPCF